MRTIIGDAQLLALQSDGYNVYLYLDNDMVEVEHICCLAHARVARKSAASLEIVGLLRSKMDVLLSEDHLPRGELMEKAVRYLDTFWKQIFRYLENGRYSIDNNIAERYIRPLAGERKNSLFFGSDKMARASAIYHTVISTCRLAGLSALEYLKLFFRKMVEGERDYTRLMPQTIGINVKSL